MPRGSPPSITHAHVRKAEEARRLGMTMALTADYIGITERNLYIWKEKGEAGSTAAGGVYLEFAQAIKSGTAQGAALSLARIQKAAKGGIWQADAWIMERVHGYRATAPVEAPPPKEEPTSSPAEDEAAALELLTRSPHILARALAALPAEAQAAVITRAQQQEE